MGFSSVPCVGPPGAAPEPGLGAFLWENTLSQDVVTDQAPWAKRHTLSPENKRRVLSTGHAYLVCSGPVPPSIATAPAWLRGQAQPQHTSTHSTSCCMGEAFIPAQTQPGWGGLLFCTLIRKWSPPSHRPCTHSMVSYVLLLWVSTKQETHLNCCMQKIQLLCEISLDLNRSKHWHYEELKWRSHHYRCVWWHQHIPPDPHRLEGMSPCKNVFQISIVGSHQTSSLWQPTFYWRLLQFSELHQHSSLTSDTPQQSAVWHLLGIAMGWFLPSSSWASKGARDPPRRDFCLPMGFKATIRLVNWAGREETRAQGSSEGDGVAGGGQKRGRTQVKEKLGGERSGKSSGK